MSKANTIELTPPTWGWVGRLYYRLAVSKEVRAIEAGREEMARAFAMAQALSELSRQLTPEQLAQRDAIIAREMASQGIDTSKAKHAGRAQRPNITE